MMFSLNKKWMDGFFCWKEMDIYRGCPCQCECTCADMGTINN